MSRQAAFDGPFRFVSFVLSHLTRLDSTQLELSCSAMVQGTVPLPVTLTKLEPSLLYTSPGYVRRIGMAKGDKMYRVMLRRFG